MNTLMQKRELIAIIEGDGSYGLDWQLTDNDNEKALLMGQKFYDEYLLDPDHALLQFGSSKKNVLLNETIEYLYSIVKTFIKTLSKNPDIESLRDKVKVLPEEEEKKLLLSEVPYIVGNENLDENWIEKIFARLEKAFAKEIKAYAGTVAQYLLSKDPDIHFAGKVYFHLVENNKGEFPFAFLATYAAERSAQGRAKHLPLKNALIEYGENSKKLLELLSTVNKASQKSPFIAELLETGEIFYPIGLNPNETYTFLKEVPLYEESGIYCRIPNWWKKRGRSVGLSVNIGGKPPSLLGIDTLVDFDVNLSVGEETISEEELENLLNQSEGLALIKGKWVEVDKNRLKETLQAYRHAKKEASSGGLTIMEAMRMRLGAEKVLEIKNKDVEWEISNGEWLNKVISNLKKPESIEPIKCGDDFNAVLREYQQRGLNWLYKIRELGLGACLADDMGLGKTIQVIALLNNLQKRKQEKVLLVVPASLIGNWTSEITKFAPKLKYYVVHPQEKDGFDIKNHELQSGIYITTYGMTARLEWIKDVVWDIVILDEAQAIKNPGTKQTKTVKQLKARSRIAMTGTPVENRLSDLWSIFDFLNKGLLGSGKEFSQFTKKLKEDSRGYERLRQVVSPFILRRLKTDKSIISDLPDKIEMKTYATLTKKQGALYKSLVDDLRIKLQSSEGIERKGIVLSALMKFKQICNHPDQYLGQGEYLEKDSGKYESLKQICETIYEKRERVLVFTQFKEITGHIAEFLKEVFGHDGLVLHGETPVAKRKDIVAKFQGHEYVPFMVLSIKAGGVGLNLTAANHVVHFDRWWNPAVENQATDRAFRIGQKKKVIVHKFITKGTVEEKIDGIIEEKTKLTKEIIPDMNESWITEMDNNQLMDLFRLSI